MATRQTNKKPSPRKTGSRKTSKSRSSGKDVFIVILLIAVLVGLITFSTIIITSSKKEEKIAEQIITVIPADKGKRQQAEKKEEKKEDKQVAIPKKDDKKVVEAPKKDDSKNKDEVIDKFASSKEIADLIRLVLYDHEISRSAVNEKATKSRSGKEIITFEITCDEDNQKSISQSISTILKRNGYKVVSSKNEIIGSRQKDEVNILLKTPKKEEKKEEQQEEEPENESKEKFSGTPAETLSETPSEKPADMGKSAGGEKPSKPKVKLPSKAGKSVKIGILLDDGGHNAELAKEYASMKYPLAVAVLPHLEHSRYTAEIAKKAGKTVFLHFPMAPKSYPSSDPGKGAIIPSMPEILIEGVVKENFESLGVSIDGFNNHMGSAITEDAQKMAQILKASKKYADIFIDSRTTAGTKAYEECRKAGGYKCGENGLFLDNDNNVNYIIKKIYEAAEKAKKNGSIIVIGHIRPNTLKALKIALPELEKLNYKIVDIKELVK